MSSPDPTQARRARLTALVFAAALAFTLSLAGSALKSTVTVYFPDIAHGVHTSVDRFAWSTTIFAVGIALASPLVGAMADRWGGSAVLATGTVLAGVALLLCAIAPGVLEFAPTYGVLGSVSYTMLSYVPLGKLADELFAGRGEGLAYAVMTDGPAVGFIVLVPLWVWLGSMLSWRTVLAAAGALMLVVLLPLAVLLGRLSARDDAEPPAPAPARTSAGERWRSVLRNRDFLIVTLAFGGCGVTMAFVDVHLVNDLQMAGMHDGVVSGTLSLLGVFELLGSLVAGRLCDQGLIRSTLVAGYLLRAVAMFLLVAAPSTAFALVFGIVFGASYMVTVVATTLWISRLLPPGLRATGLGLTWLVHQAGAALSSQLGAFAEQRSGTYGPVALTEALVVLVSAVLVVRLPRPGQPGVPGGERLPAAESAREISLPAGSVMADPEPT